MLATSGTGHPCPECSSASLRSLDRKDSRVNELLDACVTAQTASSSSSRAARDSVATAGDDDDDDLVDGIELIC